MREETDTMNQNRGLDLANAAQQSASDKFNRQATVAGLTAPQMYNAKSVTQTPFDWMGLAQMGVGIGTAALTGGASAAAGGGAASS